MCFCISDNDSDNDDDGVMSNKSNHDVCTSNRQCDDDSLLSIVNVC